MVMPAGMCTQTQFYVEKKTLIFLAFTAVVLLYRLCEMLCEIKLKIKIKEKEKIGAKKENKKSHIKQSAGTKE